MIGASNQHKVNGMNKELAFIERATERHQQAIDASYECGERFEDLKEELHVTMSNALSGLKSSVPTTVMRQGDLKYVEKLGDVSEEVLMALDEPAACRALMAVLMSSKCGFVSALRTSLINAYIRQNAERIAEARGL